MRRRVVLFALIITACSVVILDGCGDPAPPPEVTTVLLVRHAERDNGYLSSAGRERARSLAWAAEKAGVTTIYATDADRSQQTVGPLVGILQLLPDIYRYEQTTSGRPTKEEVVEQILSAHEGEVVLVAGHSDTVPAIARLLGADIPSSVTGIRDYDNLLVITRRADEASVVNLQYGESSPFDIPSIGTEPGTATTVLLVRHAQYCDPVTSSCCDPADPYCCDPDADPSCNFNDAPLSKDGYARAQQLAHLADKAGIAAIYTTETRRTRGTVHPLAHDLGLTWDLYGAGPQFDYEQFTDDVLEAHAGEVVVIAGHSNTVPTIVTAFGGEPNDCPIGGEFDNLCLVTIQKNGEAEVVNLQYGDPSPIPPPGPDLVIEALQITGPVTADPIQETVKIPIRVVVGNLGYKPAGSFHIEIEQSWDEVSFVGVCFQDPEHSDPHDPYGCFPVTGASLVPPNTVSFAGEVTAHLLSREPFFLRAKADSGNCGPNPPDYCSVRESNEENNVSASIAVPLPRGTFPP